MSEIVNGKYQYPINENEIESSKELKDMVVNDTGMTLEKLATGKCRKIYFLSSKERKDWLRAYHKVSWERDEAGNFVHDSESIGKIFDIAWQTARDWRRYVLENRIKFMDFEKNCKRWKKEITLLEEDNLTKKQMNIERRRDEVWEYLKKGYSRQAMAKALKCSLSTISEDLATMKNRK